MTNAWRSLAKSAGMPATHSSSLSGARAISGIDELAGRADPRRKRILLIGTADTPGYADVLGRWFQVHTARGVAIALAAALTETFDLVACRGRVEGGSAADWLTQARQLSTQSLPPIVVFDADDAREAVNVIALGVRQLLPAPCPPKLLAQKLGRLLVVPVEG